MTRMNLPLRAAIAGCSLLLPAFTARAMEVSHLRSEYLVNPLGIDKTKPSLSWIVESSERGEKQTAWQVLVASTAEGLAADKGDLWDSGKVAGDETDQIIYDGKPLGSRAVCFWKVKSWDKNGTPSAWSAPAKWTVGLLEASDWTAKWIDGHVFTNAAGPGEKPVILAARYEGGTAGSGSLDVKALLEAKMAEGNQAVVVANESFGGDPAFGSVKRLYVQYQVGGKTLEKTFPEKTPVILPADLTGGAAPVNATITSARYEAVDGSQGADVTRTMAELGAKGPYSTTITSNFGGTDPAKEKPKRLRIEYQRDGKAWVKYVAEKKTFNFPADLAQPDTVPYLRKSFTLAKPVRSATLYATALGIYELQLNGGRVGDHVLAPEWTDYNKRLNYQAYDVTAQLAQGANVLGAQVGSGWYSGHVGNFKTDYWGTSAGLLAQLEVTYEDGSTERIVTDGSWKMAPGPVIAADNFLGEEYDARREIAGWSKPGLDDAKWTGVLLRSEAPRTMSSQRMEPVRKHMEIKPKALTQPAPGKWTYDMGQNMVGVLRLKVTAPAGTVITIRHGERLNTNGPGSDGPAGTLYTANLRGAAATDHYTCKGGGEETWTPDFTFHGFQYVEVSGLPAKPTLDTVTGVVFSSDTAQTGEFTCSDAAVNKLQSNIVWGQRGNYLSVPTDCPQRDERLGWLGDAQVFVKTATYNADVAAFFTKWMADVRDEQPANGAVTVVAPDVGVGGGIPAWGDAMVICPWTVYQAYGDKQILRDNYEGMRKWVEYCRSTSHDNLRDNRGGDFGDWLSIGADSNKDIIGTGYYAYSAHLLAKSAAVLGNTADAAKYQALFEAIRTAFNTKYVNPSTGAFIGQGANTQCCYVMALKFDLLPTALRPLVADLLEKDVISRGNHLSTGFVGVSYLLPMLTEMGKTKTAYNLLMQDSFPSWLFSVKNGATTIWERWDGWTPDKGFQTIAMNSYNHYSLGSCGEWLYNTVAGIDQDPASAGFKQIIIRPQPGGPLTSASGTFRSVHGLITSAWKKSASGFALETTIPANTTAVVHVPAANAAEVKESGKPVEGAAGISFLGMEGGAAKFAVGAGTYKFSSGK